MFFPRTRFLECLLRLVLLRDAFKGEKSKTEQEKQLWYNYVTSMSFFLVFLAQAALSLGAPWRKLPASLGT